MQLEYCMECNTVRVKAEYGEQRTAPCRVCGAGAWMFLNVEDD